MGVRIKGNPVAAVSGLLLSLLLAACGGGGGGGGPTGGVPSGGAPSGGPPEMNITPPGGGGGTAGRFYGAVETGSRGQYCDSGWAVGVATGYTSRAAAAAAAIRQCRSEGGTDCGSPVTEFGSAYSGGNLCAATAAGRNPSGQCGLRTGRGRTLPAARAAALSACRSGGFSCETVTAACSAAGPADSYSRVAAGGSAGTPPGGPVEDGGAGGGTEFPAEPGRTTAPQGSGSDFPGITVAGDGTTRHVLALNTTGSTVRYRAGTWFEPKDGRYQRMIIISDASVPPNRVTRIPTACMQEDNPVPRRGARFYSRPKSVSGGVQTCQSRCISGRGDVQDCVWACERPGGPGDGNTGTAANRPPAIGGFTAPLTLRQGGSATYDIDNARDPDGDRLTYRAASSDRRVATASMSGRTLRVTAGRGYTGTATVTVTVTDPGGLTATATLSVRVTRAPDQWMAVAVTDLSQNCTSRGWAGFGGPYQSSADAVNAALGTCRSRVGNCPNIRLGNRANIVRGGYSSWRNSCGAIAQGDSCAGSVSSGHGTEREARQQALADCSRLTGNCRVQGSGCTPNVR